MLTADNITIRFGGIVAVNHVSIKAKDGQITGLIGPNGAGKTTFFNCISGVYKPDEGSIVFNGKHIEGLSGYQICNAGISRTYQVINLFWKMTVLENVLVGMHTRLKSSLIQSVFHGRRERAEEQDARKRAMELLRFVGLEHRANDKAMSLSYGEQRLLEIVRGLASNPQLILLDEPAAGMNTTEKNELDSLLKKIVTCDIAIIMIEHDMKLVMGICDYLYVLEDGKLLAQGEAQEIQHNPEVIRAYLGGE